MLDLTQVGDIAVLTIAHGKANALDLELCRALGSQFEELQISPARAVVVTGRGKIFSAGVDLVRLLDGGVPYIREFLPALSQAFEAVFLHPKPVVIAVNGHAIAGGCVLACGGDRRMMARNSGRIGVTELLVGVPFPTIAFEIMRFVASPTLFHDTMYSGATYPPEVGAQRGLVDDVVDADVLIDRAVAAAEELARLPGEAFSLTKRQSRQPVLDLMERHGAELDAAVEKIWTAPETLASIRDYVTRTFKKS